MLLLSLLAVTLVLLLGYSFTKDTGPNTKYARHKAVPVPSKAMLRGNSDLSSASIAKAN